MVQCYTGITGCVISPCSPSSDGGGGQTAAGPETANTGKFDLGMGVVKICNPERWLYHEGCSRLHFKSHKRSSAPERPWQPFEHAVAHPAGLFYGICSCSGWQTFLTSSQKWNAADGLRAAAAGGPLKGLRQKTAL
jgi:hypothetical protein